MITTRKENAGTLAQQQLFCKYYIQSIVTKEAFFQHKARVKWLSLRVKNTEFFHRTLKIGRAKNTNRALITDKGNIEDPTAIATGLVLKHQLLQCANLVTKVKNQRHFTSVSQHTSIL